jgi:hypothetical protein
MKSITLIIMFLVYTVGFAQTSQTPPTPPAPTVPTSPPPAPVAPSAPAPSESSNEVGHLFGFNVGIGFPYLTMAGLNYVHSSGLFSVELGYNKLNLTSNDVSIGMTKTEASVRWHPFFGSFYVGLGLGNQSLSGTSKETISGQSVEAKIEITSKTMTPQIGWMWGAGDGGFFGGIDFGFQSPSGATSTLTTNADAAVKATADYQKLEADVRDQGKKLGEIGIPTMTLVRLGYLF